MTVIHLWLKSRRNTHHYSHAEKEFSQYYNDSPIIFELLSFCHDMKLYSNHNYK